MARVGIDWHSLSDVKRYAESLGSGHLVIKFQNRVQYNIISRAKSAIWSLPTVEVLHEVK